MLPEFFSGLPTQLEGYRRRAEDARSKAENTRFGEDQRHLGFKLLGYGTSWPASSVNFVFAASPGRGVAFSP